MSKLFLIIVFMHVNPLEGTSHGPELARSAPTSGCNDAKVVLDLTRVGDLPKWKNENKSHIYEIKSGRIHINLTSIPQANRAKWLSSNNGKILFEESSLAITCMHTIPNIALFNLGTVKSTRTLGQIKALLTAAGSPLIDSCERHVALSFDTSNNIEIKTTPAYDPAKRYYSMALFTAIGRSSTRGDDTQFTFYKATYENAPVIVIEVMGAAKSYYDFAQYPI